MSERYNMIDASTGTSQSAAERILRALEGIRHGAVEIIIHAGRIVQIERTEKYVLMRHEIRPTRYNSSHLTSLLESF